MALAPIDLQMLFSQLDRVGKEVSAQKDGAVVRDTIAGYNQERLNEIKNQTVQEANDTKDGMQGLKDQNKQNHENDDTKKREDGENDEPQKKTKYTFKDPQIGNFVDISG
ncbi:hypothetical protein FACS1894190_06310 [Spirochaetia bacterium]|nr:hypothetical protein FACS1894190_06310 [Spirochaetia bacterium]